MKYIYVLLLLFTVSCSTVDHVDATKEEVSSVEICCEKCERNPDRWKPICERQQFIEEIDSALSSLEELRDDLAVAASAE